MLGSLKLQRPARRCGLRTIVNTRIGIVNRWSEERGHSNTSNSAEGPVRSGMYYAKLSFEGGIRLATVPIVR